MSILIRGMEMPDSCEFCRFHGYGGYEFERVVCSLTGRSKEKPIFSRFDDCPLAELPPHGDLISREQAFQMMLNRGYQKEAAGVILEVPTVIPASEEVET